MSTIDIGGRTVHVSNQDKLFYPDAGYSKGDAVEYYLRVAEVMVPHLQDRPLTLRRFPDGITAGGFFQKEASDYFPSWLRAEAMPARSDGTGQVRYPIADDPASLIYLADQATIEFHLWTATVSARKNPDLLVIDLDPPEGFAATELRETARRVRELFLSIGLAPFLQATGGRGYHVVTPLDKSTEYETVRALARECTEHLARQSPETLTTAFRKEKRGNRLFLDANRNGYAQTFIAPYSLRARPGAPVASPLDWSELGKADPDGYDLRRMLNRLRHKQDPWADMHIYAGSASAARDRLTERAPR